jgi:hypothetical protein
MVEFYSFGWITCSLAPEEAPAAPWENTAPQREMEYRSITFAFPVAVWEGFWVAKGWGK